MMSANSEENSINLLQMPEELGVKQSEDKTRASEEYLRVRQVAALMGVAIFISATGILLTQLDDIVLAAEALSSPPTFASFSSQNIVRDSSSLKPTVKSTFSNNFEREKLTAELERLKQDDKNLRTTNPQWLKQRRQRQTNQSSSNTSRVQSRDTRVLELPVLPPLRRFSAHDSVPQQLLIDPAVSTKFNGYIWPAAGVLTSGYGWREGRMHKGIDIAAPIGTPILAAASGEVLWAGWNAGGYGNLLKLKHPDGSMTIYAHNQRILVRRGQKVRQGQQIAEMGSTGYSRGPHLHFEIHLKGTGVVNPMAYLSKNRR
ncbi:MAG: M23 family metallopeptidase [Prochloraceae cyanobacterium]